MHGFIFGSESEQYLGLFGNVNQIFIRCFWRTPDVIARTPGGTPFWLIADLDSDTNDITNLHFSSVGV